MRCAKLFFLCFVWITSAVTSGAQTADAKRAEEEREIQKLMADNNVPALGLGLIRDGKLEGVRVFGSLKKGVPAPPGTIFNVASLTKPVVAVFTLRLVSAGQWSLDEPLDKYWVDPDLENDPRRRMLTTRLILTHRTGFPNWRWMSESKKLAFEFEPGSRYQYLGEGFEYLRRALEAKFKRPIETMVAEQLFGPLRMSETRFVWDGRMDEARFAVGHDQRGNAYPVDKAGRANAADDLLTPVGDYGKFIVSVLNSEGLSRDVFTEMTGRQLRIKENKYFGLGWGIYDGLGPGGEYALAHSGFDKGVSTQAFLLPKSKRALIILTNVDEGYKIYGELLIKYLGETDRRYRDAIPVRYLGRGSACCSHSCVIVLNNRRLRQRYAKNPTEYKMKKIEQEERRVRGKKLMRRSNLPSMESICLRLASISSLKKSLSSTKKVVEIVRFMRADIHQFNEAGSRKCFAHASGILNPSISLNRCVAFAGAEILI